GRNIVTIANEGDSTRVKVDLFPECIKLLPQAKRNVWLLVGAALSSREVQAAFVARLAPRLERRFGPKFRDVGLYAIPMLTRDVPGYQIPEHTDTHWKGITGQLYLPKDDSIS